ncbi:A/G-specific adenine glycosylase [Candidatus Kaiserbacteria bacterium]|nr:A/G-specific adenine glycosylase [Candidatus Kaiserbacteria bacterium]
MGEVEKIKTFRSVVWRYWEENGRHDLPWRKTKDPYRILVSEMMLQQTQVPRVIEKYKEFLKRFPTVHALARASLADVLKVWSGLGYNRRGKYLHDAAKAFVRDHKRPYLSDAVVLDKYKGIGPYTTSAVRVFAYNEPDILIETNIRAAYICHFFSDIPIILDREILEYAERAAKGQDPRKWHWALMDYGAHLKRSGVRNNSRSAHYTKQSKFEGSLRQVRGAILRLLYKGSSNLTSRPGLDVSKASIDKALAGLARDGLIMKEKGKWRIA